MDGSRPSPTNRSSIRTALELPVVIEGATTRAHGSTMNVGLGGAFIKTDERLAYGERVDLWMPLLGRGTLSRLPSVVRWSDPSGFGVQFLVLGANEAHALCELIVTGKMSSNLHTFAHTGARAEGSFRQ
jgi:Tfp pilus assembly protein PilZ